MICRKGAKRRFCKKHTKHLRSFQGMDYTREILRLIRGNICDGCGKPWIPGTRRLDVHHGELCGQKSRSYDRLADILKYKIFHHKCHFNQPDHTQKKK